MRPNPIPLVMAAALLLSAAELSPESYVLTTYYPAPSGVYTRIVSTSHTYLARDGGSVHVATAASSLDPAVAINVNGGVDLNQHKIINSLLPTNPGDLANKAYVDAASGGSPTAWACVGRNGPAAAGNPSATSSVNCAGPEKVVSGGCMNTGSQAMMALPVFGYPLDQGWFCKITAPGGGTVSVQAYANCCQ